MTAADAGGLLEQLLAGLGELREAAGLTQQQLADQIGVDQSNIAFWERWGKAPRGEVLPKMAQALGVTVDELLGVAPPKRRVAKGQLQEVFQEASRLPRRQQRRLAEFVRVFIAQNADANGNVQNPANALAHIIAALKKKFPRIEGPAAQDICYATENRQVAVKEVAHEADLLLDSPAGAQVREMMRYTGAGTADVVRDHLDRFAKHADADELILASAARDRHARLLTFELLRPDGP